MPIIKIVPMPGPSGTGSADIADFVFENDGDGQSTITIHNHDMRIQTTRDTDEDSDIDINSADDVWITANDSIELTSVTDDVRVYTNDGEHEWSFRANGNLALPSANAAIGSGFDGNIVTDSRTATFYADYADTTNGINNSEAVYLPVNEDTQWFSNNTYSSATITFADSTSVQTLAIYDATSQGTAAMVFQWSGPITKTFEETFPLAITGNVVQPKAHVSLVAGTSSWNFDMAGGIHFPYGPSNNRTGSGDVLRFASSFDQSIITGPPATTANPTANRLVIAGQDGAAGDSYDGEGGDLYLWAGRGGGTNGDGGDIKIDGGNGIGTGQGGYAKIRGGYSDNNTGGFIEIAAGSSGSGSGGPIEIRAGSVYNGENSSGGSINIISGYSNTAGYGGDIALTSQAGGAVILNGDGGEFLNSESPENQIATVRDLGIYPRVLASDGSPLTGSLSNVGKMLYANLTQTASEFIVPINASVAFPIGSEIKFATSDESPWHISAADYQTTTIWGEGLNYTYSNAVPFIVPINSTATLLKVDTDKWILSGLRLTD
jgi:hypothetical protein